MKKIKYVVLVVIGILAFHQPIFAEKNIERTKIEPSSRKYNTIQGVAISSIDKKPIPFATVCIEGTTFGCLTDEFGRFQFKSPSKKIKLVASCIGYEDYKKEIIFTRKQVFNIDIELIPAIVMLDEIIVKGASKGQLNKEKGYSMGLVDTENAKLQTIESIDLLNRASGVILRQSGGVGSNVQFNINGLTGNSVRIFIDGIPIRNFGSSFSLSSIPPSMIQRIEVYKGVIPATLSEDALGGAINIILKQHSQDNLSTSYSYGSFNTQR